MPRTGLVALAPCLVLASLADGQAPAPRVARYELAESRKSVSAAGERESAVRGTVTVAGGTARWDLTTGTFPRSRAGAFLVGERGGWLLDREAPVAARAGMDDLRALFVPREEGDPGPFQASVRGLEVAETEAVKGPGFRGQPTRRHRISASWTLVTSMPGRVGRLRTRLSITLDALEGAPDEVRSPLDDTSRLLDVPGPVREAVAPLLEAIRGWPVGVLVVTEAELSTELPGAGAPPGEERAPVTIRSEARRQVAELVVRAASPEDLAALAVGEGTRVVGIERIVAPRETLR